MNFIARNATSIAAAATLGLLLGCTGGGQIETPAFDAQAAAAAAMGLYDANQDGQLSKQELATVPGLQATIEEADADGDGALSADEIGKRIEALAEITLALVPFECQVSMNNRPLGGATLKLVPEKFLEGMGRAAEGVTDESGRVSPVVDDPVAKREGVTGVNPGIYRIEISLLDQDGQERIPTKYNAETKLGADVGHVPHRPVERIRLSSR